MCMTIIDDLFLSKGKKTEWMQAIANAKNELNQIKYFDRLTKLPNRLKLINDFNEYVAVHMAKDSNISLFILDVDRFRTINDLHGRDVGDMVLIKITERLRMLLGPRAIIARESEDELYILMDEVTETQTTNLARDIIDLFTKPFNVKGLTFDVTASIGISRYPETAQDIDALMQQAELSMYEVKRTGKNNYHLFMPEDAVSIERKRRIEYGLKMALRNNELHLVYQPNVRMNDEKIIGVEALLRWDHPVLGAVSPVEFIPIAEESGMINDIGCWVIHEAVRQAKEWQTKDIHLHIAVNASAIQFADIDFATRIKMALDLYDVEANTFIVEVTESVMQNIEHANRVINDLHTIGVNVAIDDFGTGYSSLSVLSHVFIDHVKIDKSFIDHVVSNANAAALVKTMIQMGKGLNLKVVAEGIEDIEQLNFLKDNACDYGQGYFFSKPVLSNEIMRLIKHEAQN